MRSIYEESYYMQNQMSYDRSPIENKSSVYSVGTGIAINTLEKEYAVYNSNIILINVNTLLRNIIEKDITVSGIISHFSTELPVLLNEISSILNLNRTLSPVIVLYAADYSRLLSPTVLRPITNNRKLLQEAIDYVIKHNKELFGPKNEGLINNIKVLFRNLNSSNSEFIAGVSSIYGSSMTPPYKRLLDIVKDISVTKNILMISSNCIDYHLARYVDNFVLLESHTGEWKKPHILNKKVFGEEYVDVPFYPATHYCLGDKSMILPQIPIKGKEILKAMAKADNWNTKSMAYVKEQIIKTFNIDSKSIF